MTVDEIIDDVLEEAGMDEGAMLRAIVKGLLNDHQRTVRRRGTSAKTAYGEVLDALAHEIVHRMNPRPEFLADEPIEPPGEGLDVEMEHLESALGLLQSCEPEDDDAGEGQPQTVDENGVVTFHVERNRPMMRLVRD